MLKTELSTEELIINKIEITEQIGIIEIKGLIGIKQTEIIKGIQNIQIKDTIKHQQQDNEIMGQMTEELPKFIDKVKAKN